MANIKSEMMPSASKGVKWTLPEPVWGYKLEASYGVRSGNPDGFPVSVISTADSTLRIRSEEIIKDGRVGLCSRIIYRYRYSWCLTTQ